MLFFSIFVVQSIEQIPRKRGSYCYHTSYYKILLQV